MCSVLFKDAFSLLKKCPHLTRICITSLYTPTEEVFQLTGLKNKNTIVFALEVNESAVFRF